MRHCNFFRCAAPAAFATLASLGTVNPALAQLTVKPDAVRQRAAMIASQYQKFVKTTGYATAEAIPGSKKAWGAALQVPGTMSAAQSGFALPPLGVEGASMPNAKVSAGVTVSEVKGQVAVFLTVFDTQTNMAVTQTSKEGITQPGPVALTTPQFTLEANRNYQARVSLMVHSNYMGGSQVSGGVLTVSEIRWML